MSTITNRKSAQYAAVCNTEEDEAELTEKEIKLLKREPRNRKWVRRLRKCNDYMHAICKSEIKV